MRYRQTVRFALRHDTEREIAGVRSGEENHQIATKCAEKTYLKKQKADLRRLFCYGAQEGTRTPTMLLAST